MMRKQIVLAAIPLIIVLVIGSVLYHIFITEKKVSLQATNGVIISFGLADDNEEGQKISQVLLRTTSSASIRVSRGAYLVLFSGDKDHNPLYKTIVVGNHNIALDTPKLSYTPDYLQKILQKQRDTIRQAIDTKVGIFDDSLVDEQLSEDGAWYTAKLEPDNTGTSDVRRIIVHHEATGWKVAAGPEVSLYIGDYPDIPPQIIRDINSR